MSSLSTPQLYGLDRDLAERAQAKYDPVREQEAIHWICQLLKLEEEPIVTGTDGDALFGLLKNGVHLCRLLNVIKSDTVKKREYTSNPKNVLAERGNIEMFLKGCKALGIPEQDLCILADIHSRASLQAVLNTIYALGRQAQVTEGYQGPVLGVKYSTTLDTIQKRNEQKEEERKRHIDHQRRKSESQLQRRLELEQEQRQEAVEDLEVRETRKLTRELSKGRISLADFQQKSTENLNKFKELKENTDVEIPEIQVAPVLYGMDRELQRERKKKYDFDREEQVMDWIEAVTKEKVTSFYDDLRDGRILCEMLNCFRANMVPRINSKDTTLAHRDNIQLYLTGCQKLGVPINSLFNVSDLYEKKDLQAVVNHFFAVSNQVHRLRIFKGPFLDGDGNITMNSPQASRHQRSRSVGQTASPIATTKFNPIEAYKNSVSASSTHLSARSTNSLDLPKKKSNLDTKTPPRSPRNNAPTITRANTLAVPNTNTSSLVVPSVNVNTVNNNNNLGSNISSNGNGVVISSHQPSPSSIINNLEHTKVDAPIIMVTPETPLRQPEEKPVEPKVNKASKPVTFHRLPFSRFFNPSR